MSTRLIQDLHAGISRRDWNAVEMAANSLRDDIEETRRILAGTGIGSLPNDYPLSRLATEAKKDGSQEVEPVAWTTNGNLAGVKEMPREARSIWGAPNGLIRVPLYAVPPPRSTVDAVRPCTCHPDDNPPNPCAQQYALSACRAAAKDGGQEVEAADMSDRFERLAEVLRGYEAWEADIIMNGDWDRETPSLTQEQFDEMLRLQDMRNAAIAKSPSSDLAASEGDI